MKLFVHTGGLFTVRVFSGSGTDSTSYFVQGEELERLLFQKPLCPCQKTSCDTSFCSASQELRNEGSHEVF